MANLLTDPPLLIDVPSQSTAQAKQSGMALAQNFLSGYWKAKEDAVQESRWLAGQAMRDAQLTQVQMQNQAAQEAADLKAKQAAALGGFYGITKKAAEQGWGPDVEKEMYDYIEQNPSISGLPEVGKIREEFQKARENRLQINIERKRNEIDLEKARLANEAKMIGKGGAAPTAVDLVDESGKAIPGVKLYNTGSTWQVVNVGTGEPLNVEPVINKKTGKPVDGVFTDERGRIIRVNNSGLSIFSGGASSAEPATTTTKPSGSVRKYDATGKRLE